MRWQSAISSASCVNYLVSMKSASKDYRFSAHENCANGKSGGSQAAK